MKAANGLNPIFEIIGLLALCAPDGQGVEPSCRALKEQGVDPATLQTLCQPVHSRYLAAFSRTMQAPEGECAEMFFVPADQDFLLLVQTVCAEHADWFEQDRPLEQDAIRLAFAQAIAEQKVESSPNMEQLVELLQTAGFAPATCWRFIRLLDRPVKWLTLLAETVQRNQPAYQKALAAVQRQLPTLLEEFADSDCLSARLAPDAPVQPVLVYPLVEIVSTGPAAMSGYAGLYIRQAYQMLEQRRAAQGEILTALKALGDASKFQILTRLRRGAKYNLELAEEMGLSAATVSHHMNVLLTCGLVRLEKRDGRVYYTLEPQTIHRLLDELEQRFL